MHRVKYITFYRANRDVFEKNLRFTKQIAPFWETWAPDSASQATPSWAIFYAPTWPKLGAPILAPKSIFYDFGTSILEPVWVDFLGGFQNRFCIFSSVLSRQNAYFFWKSVSERGSKLRPSWDPQNKLSYKNYHFSREVLRKRRFHWKINPNAEILKMSSRKLV